MADRGWATAAACAAILSVLPLVGAGSWADAAQSDGRGGVSVPTPGCLPRATPVPSGPATLVSRTTVPGTGGRVLDIVLNSPAMGDQQHVYVLLPMHFDASGATRYPVLYLLHGAGGSYSDWVRMGVQKDVDYTTIADHLVPFITVMPNGGAWGFYTDWYGSDLDQRVSGPPPAWTTYHIDELIPWVDRNLPVVTGRGGRAIAGLSMGGFGAMSYAARYPDLFSAAGSFSGVTDTDIDFPVGGEALNLFSPAFTHGPPSQCIWGDTLTQGVRWHAEDPTYLAENLSGLSLFVASGNGHAGPYDKAGQSATEVTGVVESFIYAMNQGFASALASNGIPFTEYFYGAGTHSWGYWLRDLAHFLPQMSSVFSLSAIAASSGPFNFRTVDTAFETHGYHFSIQHVAEAFTYVRGVRPGGFTVVGTGTLTVETPPQYVPGAVYRVTTAAASVLLRADPEGKLAFTVGLGAPTMVQQADFTGTDPQAFPSSVVSIRPEG